MLMTPEFWSALAAIVVIDLVLAGDNAIVIALAARNLPKELQRRAVLWGTVGAVVVRASLTVAVLSVLARVPLGAQVLPGNDYGAVGVNLGLLAPQTKYNDTSFGKSWFESGFAVSAVATAWPTSGSWGFRAQLTRSKTDGANESFPFAPIAVNDPTQWLVTGELAPSRPFVAQVF